jgi:hypothetical protein
VLHFCILLQNITLQFLQPRCPVRMRGGADGGRRRFRSSFHRHPSGAEGAKFYL